MDSDYNESKNPSRLSHIRKSLNRDVSSMVQEILISEHEMSQIEEINS